MDTGFIFLDRRHAGRALAERLKHLAAESPVVVALPRGGVPVAYEVARALRAPLDVGLVRKLGAPGQPERGIGALGEGGTVVFDQEAVRALGVTRAQLQEILVHKRAELERRRKRYRRDHPPVEVAGKTVVLVDDGLATGVTAVAAVHVLRARGARRVILAVPVCPAGVASALQSQFDAFVCLVSPRQFRSVGALYADFAQVRDSEVLELLRASRGPAGQEFTPGVERRTAESEVAIAVRDGVELSGSLLEPPEPRGLVIFVHGSGSTRQSPRNRAVARHLNRLGFATLLFDLLTRREAASRRNVFDVELLTRRLLDATRWVERIPQLRGLPIGYFGASTGAAAALRAAAGLGGALAAVVSRGGRPDLAEEALADVTAPTLLIVGGDDWNVLELNDEAETLLGGPHQLAIVPHAGHLFEEPGALEQVARLAGRWFSERMPAASAERAEAAAG